MIPLLNQPWRPYIPLHFIYREREEGRKPPWSINRRDLVYHYTVYIYIYIERERKEMNPLVNQA